MTAKARKLNTSDVTWQQLEDRQIFAGDATSDDTGFAMEAGFARFGAGEQAEVPVPYDEVWVVTRGSLTVRDDESTLTATAGEALYIPRHAPGMVQANEDTELLTVTYPPRRPQNPQASAPATGASETRMTVVERQQFLSELHVGILSIAEGDGSGPLVVPVGYDYEPGGDITFSTAENSRKMALLRAAGRASFMVQTEPYPTSTSPSRAPSSRSSPRTQMPATLGPSAISAGSWPIGFLSQAPRVNRTARWPYASGRNAGAPTIPARSTRSTRCSYSGLKHLRQARPVTGLKAC